MKNLNLRFLILGLGLSFCLSSCGGGSSSSGSSNSGGGDTTPVPTISSITPTKITAGSGSAALTVNGTNFSSTTVIQAGGVAQPTAYVSSTQVTATLSAAQVASGSQLAIVAVNGSKSSASGTPVNLEVDNPAPAITATTPMAVYVGATTPQIAVVGTGFVPTTIINVNNVAHSTAYISATQVNVTLADADVAAGGTLSLTAVNGTPGGGTSVAATVSVVNPVPQSIKVSPTYVLTNASAPPTITVTGVNFVANSTVQVNGTARTTTYVSSTQLNFTLAAADIASAQLLSIRVSNPTPGGGASPSTPFEVLQATSTPVLSQVSPASLIKGSSDQTIQVFGSNLTQQIGVYSPIVTSTVQWNGTPLVTSFAWGGGTQQSLSAVVPASLLTSTGKASITVNSITSTPATSNALQVSIDPPPPPTITSINPSSGPMNTAATITISGTGFTSSSTVALDGVTVSSTWVSSTEMTVAIPASKTSVPGNINLTVTTPAPGGGTSAATPFTVYLALSSNDMVYNAIDGMLYVSVPTSQGSIAGNSLAVIDPVTGALVREIWVGSKPNRLALSTDGTQIFVGLDGAAAIAQVDLTKGKVVNQFSLGGGPGIYNPPFTATSLAAVPGSPNSVAVAAGSSITIYDSGVARAHASSTSVGGLTFGGSASTLYLWSGTLTALTVDSTGITGSKSLYSSGYNYGSNTIQYDNGRIYLPTGVVVDASNGTLLGTFYASTSSPATGPVVSDSTLGLAFVGSSSYTGSNQVLAFNESTFNPTSGIQVNGVDTFSYPSGFQKIVRWGQNGLALNTGSQLFLFQSTIVKDLSSSPADLSVSLTAPSSAKTGDTISYKATASNGGPNGAQGAVLSFAIDSSVIVNSVTPSQGSCSNGIIIVCDLGSLANGSQATVTVSATPSTSGTPAVTADVDAVSYDSSLTNNHATASTTVIGNLYAMVPTVASISPALVQAGAGDFTLTVNGTGFNANSAVNLGTSALTTTLVNSTQLTAAVTASEIANYGWAPVTVTNSSPGGGTSNVAPLTIYATVDVQASAMTFDPFTQQLYATLPSGSTSLTGNSVVAVDPLAAKAGTPVLVGSEPNTIAETTDGNYLWIGLTGAQSLAKFDLLQQKLTATIPLSITQYNSTSSVSATSLAAMPGSDSTLAITTNGTWGNFGIFDVSGNTGSFRTNFSGIYQGVNPVFADATHIYAYDSQTSGAEFYRYSVNSNGLTLIDGTTLNGMGGFQGSVKIANGLVYGGSGGIANPLTTPPSQVAVLSPINFYQNGISDYGIGSIADPSINKEFMMLENTAGTWAYALARYDLTTYLPESWIPMPSSANSSLNGWVMSRFGQDGLALLVIVDSQINSQSKSQILLIRGPWVTPQLLGTSTAATLTSASSSSITHGAGNTMLTLTGSNFVPGTAVTWNGSYRTTNYVDATHLTVAIPASDLSAAGSASVVVTNPGGPASNTLTITIN